MKKFLTFALAAALCAPAFAQKMGSSNRNAPKLEQSIAAGDAKMSLHYTSITWGGGKTMQAAMDKANGAGAREMVNGAAAKTPLATFNTSIAVTCGDLKLAAGEYQVYFTITESCEWQINFKNGDAVSTMKLAMADSGEESKRLMMCLYAGETEGAGVYVAFGKQMCMLEFKPAKAEKKS
ncbi:MAG: hypothetical protein JNK49_17535 [Planctomycetes bacterium]|nr:hypothetical protein [Planctomycetota bacterium]